MRIVHYEVTEFRMKGVGRGDLGSWGENEDKQAAFRASEHRTDVLLAHYPLSNGVLHLRQACTAPVTRLETGFGTPGCSDQFLEPRE